MSALVSIAEARAASGLRLVSVGSVPSPWSEAAKGIFQVKKLQFLRAKHRASDAADALAQWAGDSGAPVVAYEQEKLRTGWAEILLLAERLAPEPTLVPDAPADRALLFGLSHEICGEMGLGWCIRLLMVRDSLGHAGKPGFPPEVAARLAGKYGFHPQALAAAQGRVVSILHALEERLVQRPYLLGDRLTALDIYWATFANLLTPLPESEMRMWPVARSAYTCTDEEILAALGPRLRRHQRHVYDSYLELPVRL